MLIAIISDIHDQIPRLREALRIANQRGAEVLLCCGDLCSPFIAKELGEGFAGPVHIVFGNNDGDRFRIAANGSRHPHLKFHGEYVELELGGKTFSVNHFDNMGRALARGRKHDVVCFGHNHQSEIGFEGNTLIVNPGEVYGELTGHSTFALYDSSTHRAELVEVAAEGGTLEK